MSVPFEVRDRQSYRISALTKTAIVLALLIGIPYYWLLIDSGPSDAPARPIDLARLRAEAGKLLGPLPLAIEAVVPACDDFPGTFLVASGGLKTDRVGAIVYRLVTPGGDTLLDSGLSPDQAAASGFATYDADAQRTADNWLRTAKRIVFTGQDIDHIGGFIATPSRAEFASRAIANPDQAKRISELAPALALQQSVNERHADYAAIAPGVVLLKAPGHTPGSQMIFVRLANGREYLFAGDNVPMLRNLTWLRPRSRYMAEWQGSEDRAAVIGWLKGLNALHQQAPRMIIVPAHDLGWLKGAGLREGIAAAPPVSSPAPKE